MAAETLIEISTSQHLFPLVLHRTALLVIDMQNDFCHPDGFCSSELKADVSAIRQIIPTIKQVIDWARSRNVWVVYTRESHRSDLSDATPSKQLRYANAGYPIGTLGKMGRYLVRGERGVELIDELQPLPSEFQLDKPAQSAFISTNLDTVLQGRGITHLLITGVTTECCVLGTYRQASDLGYYCLLLEDCCAAFSPIEHQAAIQVLLSEGGAIGWVTTSNKLLKQT